MSDRQAFLRGYYQYCQQFTAMSQKKAGFLEVAATVGDKIFDTSAVTMAVAPIAVGALVGYLSSRMTSPDNSADVTQRMIVARSLSNKVGEIQRKRAFRLLSAAEQNKAELTGKDIEGQPLRPLRV